MSLVTLFGAAPALSQDAVAPYLLNAGDQLEISVWKEADLQRTVIVLPDGTISFPLAGHFAAAGSRPVELQQAITDRLSPFIPDPVVTVTVVATSGNQIYVIGEVNQPGVFQVSQRLDVVQALALAGGFSTFADDSEIIILRRNAGASTAIPFDFSAIKDGKNLASNIVLQAGDTVVVPD